METNFVKKIKYLPAKLLSKALKKINSSVIESENFWQMSNLKQCDQGVCFHGRVTIVSPQNVRICRNVHIGNNSYIDGRGGVIIGENTHISRNFVVHSSSHNYESSLLPYDESYVLKAVEIGRNVWIGTNVVLVPGVRIGDGAIVGAGAVVTKSIPPLAIVGNQPTRVIKFRNQAHYECLEKQKAYGGIGGRALKH